MSLPFGMQVGKAERPGPGLAPVNRPSNNKKQSEPPRWSQMPQSPDRRGINQMIDGILYNKRQHDAKVRAAAKAAELDCSSETASLASVSTDSQSLLKKEKKPSSSSSSSTTPKTLPPPNLRSMPQMRLFM